MSFASRPVLTIVAVALSLITTTASAQSVRTIAGNPIVERDGTDAGYPNHYLADTSRPFATSGKVTHWEIWADTTFPVQLVIFRNAGGSFVEVGRSELVTPALGYNLFTLAPKAMIDVQAGDVVGAYMPVAGSISDTVYAFCVGDLGHTVLFTQPGGTTFSFSCDRVYSLRAFWDGPGQ